MFTYKAFGAAAGVLVYAILAYKFSQFDLLVSCLIAFLIGSFVWYALSFLVIKRNGLCIEFRYSKNRPGFISVTLSKRFKQLDYMEFESTVGVSGLKQEVDDQVLSDLKHFFYRHLDDINESKIVHFVGCTKNDANDIENFFTFR
jgi:hypothetical protein